jgi:hypothetical protein
MAKRLRVYLSFTYEDLKAYREAIFAGLAKAGLDVARMEDYTTTTNGQLISVYTTSVSRLGARERWKEAFVSVVCDFTEQGGEVTTERFPLDTEAAPGPNDPKAAADLGAVAAGKKLFWPPRARD